jgi:hypothetical protein
MNAIKVRFTGLDYYSMKQVRFTKTIKTGRVFTDRKTKPLSINDGKYTLPLFTISATDQADQWLSDNSRLLSEIITDPRRELHCILDWTVLEVVGKKKKAEDGLTTAESKKPESLVATLVAQTGKEFDQDFLDFFEHALHEMKESLVGIPKVQKILIVLNAMGVGSMAASNAYKHIMDYSEKLERDYELRKAKRLNTSENEQRN